MRSERVCFGKERFDTHKAATGAMWSLITQGKLKRVDVRVYRCPMCLTFHFGHRLGYRRRNR